MDLAILSSRIFTGNPRQPWAEALGIRGNRIVAVGENRVVRDALSRSNATVLELPGRLVTPGLVDAHCHFSYLGLSLLKINLGGQPSLAACREQIRGRVAEHPPGEWIQGQGWNQFQWEDTREPTRKDLDDLTPDHPAVMTRVCGHTVWVNSLALKEAGITRDTPDPPGGRIERDPDTGEPNGLLREAGGLVERVMPKPTRKNWEKAILASQEVSLGFGLTGVHTFESLHQWEVMRSLEKEGKLKIRVHHGLQARDLEKISDLELHSGFGSRRLWVGHIKLFADGTLGSGTALLHEPYADDASRSGIAVTPVEAMTGSISRAYELGFDVAIHSIGDKATTNSLEAISQGRSQSAGYRSSRDCIEHVQLFHPGDISIFKDLGAVASVQPVFLSTDWAVADSRWGPDRCRAGGYAWRTISNAGIPMQFGSDAPVESNNPLLGLQAAVARQSMDGKPEGGWHPAQTLTLEESLRGYTEIAAWTARKEAHLGSIAVGKWADITVFEHDLFLEPATHWPAINVEMTIVDGEIV